MNKLIELLNEYEAKRHKTSIVADIRKGKEDRLSYLEMNWNYSELLCISKGYEFIKWLVDNDKIDTGGKITEDLTYEYFQIPRKYFRGGKYARLSEEMNDIFYHRILACLSIQDNPIEFLISVLK